MPQHINGLNSNQNENRRFSGFHSDLSLGKSFFEKPDWKSMNIENLSTLEIQQNVNGELTKRQKYFLIKWFALHLANVVPMTIVTLACWQIHIMFGLVTTLTTLGFAIFVARNYILDLCYQGPESATGKIKKFKRRTRGPTHYLVTIQDMEIRVPKNIWLILEDNSEHMIFYAPNSQWLLSYVRSHSKNDPQK